MKSLSSSLCLLVLCLLGTMSADCQEIHPSILKHQWPAHWINYPGGDPQDYGVFLFRTTFELDSLPEQFVVHLSADNRYKFFVNEKLVSLGPARGDLKHWNYETIDLRPYLQAGLNVLAAKVWNEGSWRPQAQITHRTGFILQLAGGIQSVINSGSNWRCFKDESYKALPFRPERAYYVAGPGEKREMDKSLQAWKAVDFDDRSWPRPSLYMSGTPKGRVGPYGTPLGWMLVPSPIPQMELREERLEKLAEVEGNVVLLADFPREKGDLIIPPHSSVRLLMDQGHLTNAYSKLIFSRGKEAVLSLEYAESLYDNYPAKGNRNETKGKSLIGRTDRIISSGGEKQEFTSLSYRTYRYVELRVETAEDSLFVHDFYGTFTAFPFEYKCHIASSRPEIQQMMEVGWRTARLCATEIYMDCPYYEQMQYIGDTRIQALVSIFNSGDARLVRAALDIMDYSREPEGITLSRHPSYTPQYIPTFSLWYIGMLSDYSRYVDDPEFVRRKISGTRQILEYFEDHRQEDGSVANVPHWMFTDWVKFKNWKSGEGPRGKDGSSALIDLQLLLAYRTAQKLEKEFGMQGFVELYQKKIDHLSALVKSKYFDEEKQMFADREAKDSYSQHTNILAILGEVVKGQGAEELAKKILLQKNEMAQASIYFKYYLHRALLKAGMGEQYLDWLDVWRENLKMGLTTWAEKPNINTSRSDCHAWGSSPNVEFFRIILGIDSDAPGFARVKITPHLGEIKKISGKMPHPKGEISVSYEWKKGKWQVDIRLPKGIEGEFIWQGEAFPLNEGENALRLKARKR